MDKLFGIFLDFSNEANEKKTKVLVTIAYYFTSIIISIWLGYKLGFEINGFEFRVEYFVSLFSELSIVVPFFLFIIVNLFSSVLVNLLAILFFYFLKLLRYSMYKKPARKNNLLILKYKEVVEYNGEKVVKGKRFDEYIAKMISMKNSLQKIENVSKKMPIVIFSIWFIYVQIIRVQFENLYFLLISIIFTLIVLFMLFIMGLTLYYNFRIPLDEKYLISFELLDENYSEIKNKKNEK